MMPPLDGVDPSLRPLLTELERSWNANSLVAAIRALPPAGDPRRLPALVGLVRLDMTRRWPADRRFGVEAYLRPLPELASSEPLLALIRTEDELRQRHGEPCGPELFVGRFPAHAEAIRRALDASPPTTGAPIGTGPFLPPPSGAGDLPERFGRYRILRKLGGGGMGQVYLAQDEQLGRRVALKVPSFAGETPRDVLERFLLEARAAAKLRHPNLCPVFDAGEVGGTYFLTMAYLEGMTLAEVIARGGPMPERAAASVARKLALGLQAAHEGGVVHRDLKPANVMVVRGGEPVVMDFGLAMSSERADERLTRAGQALGTPAYMAPEQVRGDLAALGPATDVYALGVVVYEMLTGKRPFRAGSTNEVMSLVLTAEPEPPSRHRKGVDERLEKLCLACLAKDPARRPKMAAVARELSVILRSKKKTAEGGPAAPAPDKVRPAEAAEEKGDAPGTGTTVIAELVARLEHVQAGGGRSSWRAWVAGGIAAALVLAALGVALFPGLRERPVNVRITGVTLINDHSVNFFLDGKPVDREALRGELALRPGEHELVARRGEVEVEVRRFRVGRADAGRVVAGEAPDDPADKVGEIHRLVGLTDPQAFTVRFTTDGLVVSHDLNGISWWSAQTGREARRYTPRYSDYAYVHAFGLCTSKNEIIHVLGTGDILATSVLEASKPGSTRPRLVANLAGPCSCIDVSVSEKYFVTAVSGYHFYTWLTVAPPNMPGRNIVTVWDTETKKEVNRLQGQVAAFALDGEHVVTGHHKDVLVWKAVGSTLPVAKLIGHTDTVFTVAGARDGSRVVSGSKDTTVRVWDVTTGKELHCLKGHKKPVRAVAISLDGRRALSGCEGGDLRLWDLETGAEVIAWEKAHDGIVWCVTFSPGGRRAASSSADRTVRLWGLPE